MNEVINEIEKYVKHFRKKRKFRNSNIDEINKVLTPQKYYDFINRLYSYNNLKWQLKENIRLCLQYYIDMNKNNEYFKR